MFIESFLELKPVESCVKLHRNIIDILNDRNTLTFFVQYLESKNGLAWVKFWLDLEAFKEVQNEHAPESRQESRNSNYEGDKFKHKRSESTDLSISTTYSESNIDETEEEVQSNVGDEVDYLTKVEPLMQSLTDDEKSKICEKKRKKDEVDDEVLTECDKVHPNKRKIQPSIFEDALRIYRKYLTNDSSYSIELPATILSKLSLALCTTDDDGTDCDQKSNNLWDVFEEAQKHVRDVMEKEFLSGFLESSFYCKYTVDVLTSEELSLREILCSESALFYFMEFLEQDRDNCKIPYLEFWLAATNFRKQSHQVTQHDRSQMKADALVIYEKWLSLQATAPLNFSNKVRMNIEGKICSMDSTIEICFDEATLIVETFLEHSCFKKFMKSQLFFKHLSEVMSKIEGSDKHCQSNGIIRRNSNLNVNFPVQIRHRRTNSDSIEKKGIPRSISTQNTLLAGLDPKKTKNTTDLQIDSRQLDPNLLWHRRLSGTGLAFGRVDAYGRYERDFELPGSTTIATSKSAFHLQQNSIDVEDTQSLLELDSSQNRFKNAMRKLVHLPEDSLQQEIAWQVAEMIVKDVTNITLKNDNVT